MFLHSRCSEGEIKDKTAGADDVRVVAGAAVGGGSGCPVVVVGASLSHGCDTVLDV